MNLTPTTRASEFDSSDEEFEEEHHLPLQVSWLDLAVLNYQQSLGICALPDFQILQLLLAFNPYPEVFPKGHFCLQGCKFKDVRRNLQKDLEDLKSYNIQDVFVFCTKGEMVKYRVPNLLESYQQEGFMVHHHPLPDGSVPDIASCWKILEELRICLENGKTTLVQCYGGLGRSCLIAACLLQLSDTMLPEEAINLLRELRGTRAIQTVKQYNYLHDFRDNVATYLETKEDSPCRSVSR
ncbi:cyclin-dependent kinase inhibitor 3 isoform X1 [Hypanus sabinus]|uniref:cyclin-dependent kinase inhibitor 3 isoform X1 n=1 Tax=Hypanus sabinus TaxID=79690 RepID=UPI0028C3C65E|nr:cyclin-dependent kinase inhibitor 3 isoform X1 [Hypanus sabinus]